MFSLFGERMDSITEAFAGQIVAITKLDDVYTGDTLCDVKQVTYLCGLLNFQLLFTIRALKPKNPRDARKTL